MENKNDGSLADLRTRFKTKKYVEENPDEFVQRGNHKYGGKRVWNVHNGKQYCLEDDPQLGAVNGKDGRFNQCIRAEKKGLVILSESQMVGKQIQNLSTEVIIDNFKVNKNELEGRGINIDEL